jgi:branched-chain amino acid transport system substrate-binding protein
VDDFKARATAAKVPFPVFETQAAASWNAWQILIGAVKGAGRIDQKAMCDYLHGNECGHHLQRTSHLRPEVNNFWPTTLGIKQIKMDWVMVWPVDRAAVPCRGRRAGLRSVDRTLPVSPWRHGQT